MIRKPILALLALACASMLSAQSLQEAKTLFKQQEYAKAKPAFKRLVKNTPNNASYNYWYGACCYETGEKELSEKYLKFGAKRKVQEAFRYLGQLYFDQYKFEESLENYESYREMLEKSKKPTAEVEAAINRVKLAGRLLKGVEKVTIIDSFVVDKDKLLETYFLSPESGKITTYNQFFKTTEDHPGMVYRTELGNKLYYSDLSEGNLNIYQKNKQLDNWGKARPLQGQINTEGNENYPYVLSDGITLYYASDGEGSIGGYDIFVTRYNTNTNSYLVPDNIGMPFNSPANDYLFVWDEFNELGWFASDRFQPEDKVCVYVFIPNESKQTFSYENEDISFIRKRAQIHSIQDTWEDKDAVKAAVQRFTRARYSRPEKEEKYDFQFVIDDNTVYYEEEDFRCPEAKKLLKQWQQKQKDYQQLQEKLNKQREMYHKSQTAAKKSMAPALLDLEQRAEQLEAELLSFPKQIRNTELLFLSR